MALVIKTLDNKHISTPGVNDLYTVPASKSALISSARIVNRGNAVNTSVLVLKSGGQGNGLLVTKNLAVLAASGSLVMEDPVTLGAGDKLRIDVSGTSPNIDCQINGVERDV